MIVRRDHVAGGAFVAAGVLLYALSGELPFGSLASPGAGLMPKLVLALMMVFGAILMVRASDSPPITALEWSDRSHAATVVGVSAVAIGLYTVIGFVPTISLLLFVLLYVVERRRLWPAVAVSLSVSLGAYFLFGTLLKSPLPPMPIGF